MGRLAAALLALAAAALLAAGCGDDDSGGGGESGGGGGGAGGKVTTQEAPKSRDEAIDRCYEDADRLEGQARATARSACKAAETGDTSEIRKQAERLVRDEIDRIKRAAAAREQRSGG